MVLAVRRFGRGGRGGGGRFGADGVADVRGLLGVAVLGGGFGGPEERVDAPGDGPLGHFGEGDGVDGGVEGGFGVGVAEGAALSVRAFESFLPAEDFEDDAAGGVQAAGGQPVWRLRGRDQGF